MSKTSDDFWAVAQARWPALLAYAHVLTADPHDAADLVQEALSRAGAAWPRVVKQGDPEGYIRRAMVNAHISRWRRRRREALVDVVPDVRHEPGLDSQADILSLRAALGQLTPRQRAALVLRYYDGLSINETAKALGCAPGTVKSQTHDALKRLAPLLSEHAPRANLGDPQ